MKERPSRLPVVLRLFPSACSACALIGALCLMGIAASLTKSGLGTWGHLDAFPFWSIAGALLLAWGALWSLFDWKAGAGRWVWVAAITALAWTPAIFVNIDWTYFAPIPLLALAMSAWNIGAAAVGRSTPPVGHLRASILGGLAAVAAAFALGVVPVGNAVSASFVEIEPQYAAILQTIVLPILFLAASWIVGYALPMLWPALTAVERRSGASKMPCIAGGVTVLALLYIATCAWRVGAFERKTLPAFMEYIGRSIAPPPPAVTEWYSFVHVIDPWRVEVSRAYDASLSIKVQESMSLSARVPFSWSERSGLYKGIEIESLTYSVSGADYPDLAYSPAIQRFLSGIGASRAVRTVNWRLQNENPLADSSPAWIAESTIGGVPMLLSIGMEDGKVTLHVSPRRSR